MGLFGSLFGGGDLKIEEATIGYNAEGMSDLVNKVKDELETLKSAMAISATQVKQGIPEFWVGEAADSFKNKIDSNTESLMSSLDEIQTGLVEQLRTVMTNTSESDVAIAKSIDDM